jgi:hypothetical protein
MSKQTGATREWFDKTIWALHPNGFDPDQTFIVFFDVLKKEKKPNSNEIITKEYLLEKFSEYIEYKDSLGPGASFKDRNKVSLHEWLSDQLWKQTFKARVEHNPLRDKYLYGIDY